MVQKRDAGWDEQDIPVIPPSKNYLLAIGINDYTHCPKLHNAVKDVEDFAALMGDKYGFEEAQIQLLCKEDATAERIMAAFKSLVRAVQPSDNVLIYFSGHGELDDILDEGFWIPIEAERGKENQYIRNSTIHKVLQKINSFHTFLIVDSCYFGSLFLDGKSKFVSAAYDLPSRWCLTSGRNTIVSDGKAGTNSPFADALLDTLRRIDQPMNVSALCDIIKQTVPAATNKLQLPTGDPLSIEGHKGGQFIFSPKVVVSPELADWDKAKAENTESAYSRYLRKDRHGQFADAAEAALARLEEEKEEVFWKETIQKNTLLAYHQYLRKYLNGKYAEAADQRLEAYESQESAEKEQREKAEIARTAKAVKEAVDLLERVAKVEKERIEREKQEELEKQKNRSPFEPEMVFVEGGVFQMAENYKVSLSDFFIGKFPVTQAEWKAVMGNNPSQFQGDERCPVEEVSWDDVQVFLKKLNDKTGKKYRLLTEAEWEFAARGGRKSKGFEFSGSNNLDEVAWTDKNSAQKTHPVGTKNANELGIHDMSGNLWEWCNDWYGAYNDYGKVVLDPAGPIKGSYRIHRGGSWFPNPDNCRLSRRGNCDPDEHAGYIGFRVASSAQ